MFVQRLWLFSLWWITFCICIVVSIQHFIFDSNSLIQAMVYSLLWGTEFQTELYICHLPPTILRFIFLLWNLSAVLLTRTCLSFKAKAKYWRQNTFKDRFKLRFAREHKTKKSNSMMAQVHAIKTLLNGVKGSKLSKLSSSLICHGELTKNLTLEAKDLKFVLEDISRPMTKDNTACLCLVIVHFSIVWMLQTLTEIYFLKRVKFITTILCTIAVDIFRLQVK